MDAFESVLRPVGEKKDINELLAGIQKAKQVWQSKGLTLISEAEKVQQVFRDNDRILLEAETGSGKSTAAPVLLLDELLKTNPNARIAVSQPRRIATENLYGHVGGIVGSDYIGFRHKQDRHLTADTRITYMVEKSLLNEIIRDPFLLKYDAVVLDEIHERTIDMDIIMPLLKKVQAERAKMGKNLKVVLTSATVDRKKILKYFDGAVSLPVEGRTYEVEEEFLTEPIERRDVIEKAAERASAIINENKEKGDILIFMPGRNEIEKTVVALGGLIHDPNIEIVSLIGGDETTDAYKKNTGKRKIIVATNVAETSITIDTVKIVIDSGLMRTNICDDETGITELTTIDHTQANARQRKGRAGRTENGKVYYLFTKDEFAKRKEFLNPEILRTNLISQVLQMKYMGIEDVYNFDFLDHPGKEKIDQAIETLYKLGALDANRNLTSDIGKRMAEKEVDPHFARMIVEAENLGCLDAVSLLVGLMNSQRSVFDSQFQPEKKFMDRYGRFAIPGSDFLTLINIWNEYIQNNGSKGQRQAWEAQTGINAYALYNASNERRDFLHNRKMDNKVIDLSPQSKYAISLCVAAGLMDRVLLKNNDGTYILQNEKRSGIIPDRYSVLQNSQPNMIVSGNIRSVEINENLKKTYAMFNMGVDEKLLRVAAPHLYPKEAEEKPSLPKPENAPQVIKRNEESAVIQNVVQNPSQQGSESSEAINYLVNAGIAEREMEKVLPKTIFQKIKEFGWKVIKLPITVIQKIWRFVFGGKKKE